MTLKRVLIAVVVAATLGLGLAAVPGSGPAGAQISVPDGLPDLGTLTLTTGKGASATNQFDYAPGGAGSSAPGTQTITDTRCEIGFSGATLVSLDTSRGSPGINDGSIGDKTRGRGVNCGRTEEPQSLTLSLAGSLAELQMSSIALDIEVKKDAWITATAYLEGAITDTFELRTGSSVVAGEGSTDPGTEIFNCAARSDSGPDSGGSDNCRWERELLADSIVFATTAGEWSLEGGADGTGTAPSEITLTKVSGVLDCESQPNSGDFDLTEGGPGGDDDPLVGIVRKDNLDSAEPCRLIPVFLETSNDGGDQEIVFTKDLTNQISAAFVINAIWDVEDAANPPAATMFDFDLGSGAFPLELCVGTPVYDSAGDFDGIAELLDSSTANDPPVDQETGTPGIQYACYFQQELDLVGNGEIVLAQGIYLIGDWRSFR